MSLKEEPSRTVFYLETTGDEESDLKCLEALGYPHQYSQSYPRYVTEYCKGLIMYITSDIFYPEIMPKEHFFPSFTNWNLVFVDSSLIFIGAL